MGYSYVVVGDLAFESASQRGGWREIAGTVLAQFGAAEVASLEETETSVRLRALVDKDSDEYLEGRAPLVAAFRKAADFGGRGELVVASYIDYAGTDGLRVTVEPGASSSKELDEQELSAVHTGPAVAELEALVSRIAAEPSASAEPYVSPAQRLHDADTAYASILRDAPDMATVLAKLRAGLPQDAGHMEKGMLPGSAVVRALVERRDPDATARMLARMKELGFGSSDDDRLQIAALAEALYKRGDAHDEVHALWLDAPNHFLRNHERLKALGRRDIDEQLASRLGTTYDRDGSDNHRWIVEAFFATAGDDAPARAAALLEGDIRARPGAIESLRWIVITLEPVERRSPGWEQLLRRVVTEPPWAESPRDPLDQVRSSAIEVLATWKASDALALVRENIERIGEIAAVRCLVALGDPAAIPLIEGFLAASKRKADRTYLQAVITRLGGAAPAAGPAVGEHVIDAAPSGRASCRACKQKIAKGELRFGEAAKNVFSEGGEASMRWFHLKCAAEKKPKIFGPTLAAYTGEVPDRAALVAIVETATAGKRKKR